MYTFKKDEPMTELMDFLKTISDETRLRILALLSEKELCVCEMCYILEESQPKVSRHLAKLRDMGLVQDKRQGQWILYYLSIQDNMASEILRAIVKNYEQYPLLVKDRERLSDQMDKGLLSKTLMSDLKAL
jgi:DNA-binding transcriptional ArsR family regulator